VRRRPLRHLRQSVVSLTALFAIMLIGAAVWVARPLPPDVAAPGPVASLELRDRHGTVLRTTRAQDGTRGGWIPFADIDPEIIQAFLAAEDRRFFDHHGVDGRAVLRALRDNLRARRIVSGASTLTMQTARLLRPADRDWFGKAMQALWALRLEAHLDKQQILETYLNRVPLGQGATGISAAAHLYFGTHAADVSLAQAALLAGLAHLPARENPLVNAERARVRRNAVLERMRQIGFAIDDDVDRALREPVLVPDVATRFAAPHFTTRLLLDAPAGATGTLQTTLDLELQHALEAEVRHAVRVLEERNVRHAAAVVLDNRSGDVLAWVGSPDFAADTAGQVDMVVSRRQPGSTLKPFLYGLAFDRGWTPATVLPDVPRTWATSTGPYQPQNYDRRFRGPVRIREALASSYNVPAVEMADRVGTAALLQTLRDAGMQSLDRPADWYGLGLSLGNGEVTLLELANAYRGMASGGVARPVRMLENSAVRTRSVIPAADEHGVRFMSPGAAALVLDILTDPVARMPGFGAGTPFDFPFPTAAKTGTSRHFTDNWAVATTANFTVAVWVGNFSGQPMQGVSGISGAGPLLYRTVLEVAKRYPPGLLPTPDAVGAEPVRICALSGLRATPDCASLIEWFLPGTAPDRTDDWQVAGRTTLPPEYAEWLAMNAATGLGTTADAGTALTGSETANARITSPLDGDVYELPPGVPHEFVSLPLIATRADPTWVLDGRRHTGGRLTPAAGDHTLVAVWPDGARDSVRFTVRRIDSR
jgi:penicillin-binding protein 1C